jgi:hypothetical protein
MVAEYVLPLGLHVDDGLGEPFDEGYEVHWRDAEDPPHYFFNAQVSVLRLERLVPAALRVLPTFCHAVLEVRRSDAEMEAEPEGPSVDRYVSELLPRGEVLAVYDRYRFPLLHDGMVGFGAYDPSSVFEVFLDDHKLLSLFSPTMEPFEQLLASHRVPHRSDLHTLLDVDHEHHTLPAVPDRCRVPRAAALRRQRLDVQWFAPAIRRRLGMQPERLFHDRDS